MPTLQVTFSHPAPSRPDLKAAVAHALADLVARVLGKARPLTAVMVTEIAPADWFVGDRSLADFGQASHHVVVRVTEGTNTKAEKARFVAEAHDKLAALLEPIRPESYVVVEEVRADAWGWGGETQEHRAVAAELAATAETSHVFDTYRRFGVR